ncbi:MAG: sigma 54-interacting transcriptional regulator [Deltaproteobacteria bacterium]|jgi:two-component system response regulator AtoC
MRHEDETERTLDRSQFEAQQDRGRRLRLVVIGDDLVTTHPIPTRGTLLIGRDAACDVFVDHALISREHARVTASEGSVTVEDLGSRNGTRVDGRALEPGRPVEISSGQLFEVGETSCLVQASHAAPRARRLATHGYFEARVEALCASAAGGFSVLRVHLGDDVDAGTALAALSEADLVGNYATGELEALLRSPDARERAETRLTALEGTRCGAAVFPSDGRTVDELLETACRRVLGPSRTAPAGRIVADPRMKDLYRVVERVARGTISVLLLGETGVGKEVVAEAIHRASPRRHRPFLRLNCAALSDTLLESELFGHEKGAFTGASEQRAGLLESAQGGTVMLDELGEMPLPTQAKLLRVLEQRQVMRVGGREPIAIDVRFVSATNRDLEAEVLRGTFRQDVYFRLNGAALTVPPLRERPLEIDALAEQFLGQASADLDLDPPLELSDAARELLKAYAWPGNVRELKNAIERAALLTTGDAVEPEHLPMEKMSLPQIGDASSAEQAERQRILDALEKTAGNQTRAAALLGIGRRTLTTKLTKYGIRRPRKR